MKLNNAYVRFTTSDVERALTLLVNEGRSASTPPLEIKDLIVTHSNGYMLSAVVNSVVQKEPEDPMGMEAV